MLVRALNPKSQNRGRDYARAEKSVMLRMNAPFEIYTTHVSVVVVYNYCKEIYECLYV